MCVQVLTLWQEAKAVVEAWPTYPDALAVSNLVAEELGDESANARLLLLKQVCPLTPSERLKSWQMCTWAMLSVLLCIKSTYKVRALEAVLGCHFMKTWSCSRSVQVSRYCVSHQCQSKLGMLCIAGICSSHVLQDTSQYSWLCTRRARHFTRDVVDLFARHEQAPGAAALEASTPRPSVMLQLIHG